MNKETDTLFAILSKQIIEYTGKEVDVSKLPLDTRIDSFNLDSLTMIEAINTLEDELGIELPFSANAGVMPQTLADMVALFDEVAQ